MDINNLIEMGKEFVNTQPFIALGVVAFILAFIYFKPKAAFKSLVGVGAIFLAAYLFMSLTGTMNRGINNTEALHEDQ